MDHEDIALTLQQLLLINLSDHPFTSQNLTKIGASMIVYHHMTHVTLVQGIEISKLSIRKV